MEILRNYSTLKHVLCLRPYARLSGLSIILFCYFQKLRGDSI
nr:MAG TPA: hypothetical protein [Caudoviricetes sp.]